MTAQKIHIILFSSILILFCVRIAHTAPAEQQQDSSDFTIIDLCMTFITTINVDPNDTGFILTSSNCSSQFGETFQFNYVDADANDAEVIFGWSSTSSVFISTGGNGQNQVQKVTANESYWNPTRGVIYYFPNGHNVTLTVYKGCFKSNVTDESVKSERLVSDVRKERFTCENSKQLVNNMNQFSGSQVLSCDLNTRTWENYDVSCNGPLRCVDENSNPQCEVWRIHDNTVFNVTCSNANFADELSFNIQCENQLVLGILNGSFRSEISSLEVTCKETSGSKSWFTSTYEIIPPLIQYGCFNSSMGAAVTNSTEKDIKMYEGAILTIVKQKKTIVERNKTIVERNKTIGRQQEVIYGVSPSLGVIGVYAIAGTVLVLVAYFKLRKRILWKKLPKTTSDAVTPMGLADGPSTVRPYSGTTYHVLERNLSALLTRNTTYEEISDLKFERKRTDVAGEYASNDMHAPKPTEAAGLYEVVNLDNNGQLQKVVVSQPEPEAQPEMPNETYASVNKIGRKSRIETQAGAELKQIEQTQPSNENDYQPALPEGNLTQSSPNETG